MFLSASLWDPDPLNNNRYINVIEILLIILNIINITVSIMCGLWLVKVLMISIRHVALLVYY